MTSPGSSGPSPPKYWSNQPSQNIVRYPGFANGQTASTLTGARLTIPHGQKGFCILIQLGKSAPANRLVARHLLPHQARVRWAAVRRSRIQHHPPSIAFATNTPTKPTPAFFSSTFAHQERRPKTQSSNINSSLDSGFGHLGSSSKNGPSTSPAGEQVSSILEGLTFPVKKEAYCRQSIQG